MLVKHHLQQRGRPLLVQNSLVSTSDRFHLAVNDCVTQDSCATHIERVRQKNSNPNMESLTLGNNVRITGIRDCMRVCVAIVKLGFSCCAAGSVLCLFYVVTHA